MLLLHLLQRQSEMERWTCGRTAKNGSNRRKCNEKKTRTQRRKFTERNTRQQMTFSIMAPCLLSEQYLHQAFPLRRHSSPFTPATHGRRAAGCQLSDLARQSAPVNTHTYTTSSNTILGKAWRHNWETDVRLNNA